MGGAIRVETLAKRERKRGANYFGKGLCDPLLESRRRGAQGSSIQGRGAAATFQEEERIRGRPNPSPRWWAHHPRWASKRLGAASPIGPWRGTNKVAH